METRLREILQSVNEWLKFAETKNAALIATNTAIAIALVTLIKGQDSIPEFLRYYMFSAGFFLLTGALLSLTSFLPKTKLPSLRPKRLPNPSDNLLYYGDIADYDPQTYLEALQAHVGVSQCTLSSLEEDYAEQIIINSRITLRKFTIFALAVSITLCGVLTPILGIPILVLTDWG